MGMSKKRVKIVINSVSAQPVILLQLNMLYNVKSDGKMIMNDDYSFL
jgi:hypothetical protein